jgi:hypothetical protein
MWPDGAKAKHKGRDTPKDAPARWFAFRILVGSPAP